MTDSTPIINAASKQDAGSTGSTAPESTPQTGSNPGADASLTSNPTTVTGSNPTSNTSLDPLETLLNKAKAKALLSASASSNEVPPDEVENIVKEILESKKLAVTAENKEKVKCSIVVLAQEGAASPKAADSRTTSLFDVTISVREIREILQKRKTTFRKLARSLKKLAIRVAEKLELEGNLAKSYKLEFPEADSQDLIWVSDFQTFNNDPQMPPQVRTWLLKNYKHRFTKDKE